MLSTSYSIGPVSAKDAAQVGGLIGHDYKNGTVERAYWDINTSGTSDAAGNRSDIHGATGLTTSEFLSGLPTGFDPKIWRSDPDINNGYPYLLANLPQ